MRYKSFIIDAMKFNTVYSDQLHETKIAHWDKFSTASAWMVESVIECLV